MQKEETPSFVRNRYYSGKMLTSSDFKAEQEYMNNKRRFLNKMKAGPGIICGLNVISLDDLSVLVESGAALDGNGREIVVDSSVVKKLSAIEGFEELQTDRVSLCIRYREEETQPVYSVLGNEDGREYENNRIREGYELFLIDSRDAEKHFEAETEFFTGGILFENGDIRLSLRLPAVICAGSYVKALLEAEKLSGENLKFGYEGVLQSTALTGCFGEKELTITLEEVSLSAGEKLTRELWFKAGDEERSGCALLVKPESAKAVINGEESRPSQSLNLFLTVTGMEAHELALKEAAKLNLELKTGGAPDFVRLADLTLVKTQAAYLIEEVTEDGVKSYIPTVRDERLRKTFEGFFHRKLPFYERRGRADGLSGERQDSVTGPAGRTEIETGLVEVPLGGNARKGDICYSGEVFHGLGRGNVFVEIGYECLRPDPVTGEDTRTTVYGNAGLFSEKDSPAVCIQTAVKVFCDRGSFIVAVKLLKDVDYLTLGFRYAAVKTLSEEDLSLTADYEDKSIHVLTPTVVLAAKESCHFEVGFRNMKSCPVSYELTEPESGEITPDGIYTAPARDGVYEIRIYCTEMPLICTYAYAIVKRREEGVAQPKA